MSKDSWKAGINENTGIIFSDKSTEAQRNAAQKANQRIFEEFGDEARQGMGKMGIGMKNKGGAILKKNVEKMAYGGMSGGKKHMYLAPGGVVKDNPGLKALRESGPKGMEAYKKITRSK